MHFRRNERTAIATKLYLWSPLIRPLLFLQRGSPDFSSPFQNVRVFLTDTNADALHALTHTVTNFCWFIFSLKYFCSFFYKGIFARPVNIAFCLVAVLLVSSVFAGEIFTSVWTVLSPSAGRKREWFPVEEAIKILQNHKPVHAEYLRRLQLCSATNNGNHLLPSPPPNDNTPRYSTPPAAPRR